MISVQLLFFRSIDWHYQNEFDLCQKGRDQKLIKLLEIVLHILPRVKWIRLMPKGARSKAHKTWETEVMNKFREPRKSVLGNLTTPLSRQAILQIWPSPRMLPAALGIRHRTIYPRMRVKVDCPARWWIWAQYKIEHYREPITTLSLPGSHRTISTKAHHRFLSASISMGPHDLVNNWSRVM